MYGTLQYPLDASNLQDELDKIKQEYPVALFLAVDAAQGPRHLLGNVTVRRGPLYPGIGLGWNLPPVGDVSITGVVRTRSSYLVRWVKTGENIPEVWAKSLAEVIAKGIKYAFLDLMLG